MKQTATEKIIILQESKRQGKKGIISQYFFTLPVKIVRLKGWTAKTKLKLYINNEGKLFIEKV